MTLTVVSGTLTAVCIFFWRFLADYSAELLHRSFHVCAQVQEGGRLQLSTNHISIGGQDTPTKDLFVWLIRPPKYGFIENTKRGELHTNYD